MSPAQNFAGDRRILGAYLDFYMVAKDSETGTVTAGIADLMVRWAATEADVRACLDTLMEAGLITRLDQTPDGSLYAVRGVVARTEERYGPVFERAWKAYPRRKGHSKSLAWKRWQALVKKQGWSEEELEELVAGYAAQCRAHGMEDRFIKHMSSFLNHEFLLDVEFDTAPQREDDDGAPSPESIMGNLKRRTA